MTTFWGEKITAIAIESVARWATSRSVFSYYFINKRVVRSPTFANIQNRPFFTAKCRRMETQIYSSP
jgi:hypothetical protein